MITNSVHAPLACALGLLWALGGCGHQSGPSSASDQSAPADGNDNDGVVEVPAKIAGSTAVGFEPNTPPPWPKGNCITVKPDADVGGRQPDGAVDDGWHVGNMHGENFSAFVAQAGMKTIKVLPIDGRYCLIVDSRVPREWFLSEPCETCVPALTRDKMRGQAKYFRESDQTSKE